MKIYCTIKIHHNYIIQFIICGDVEYPLCSPESNAPLRCLLSNNLVGTRCTVGQVAFFEFLGAHPFELRLGWGTTCVLVAVRSGEWPPGSVATCPCPILG